MKFASIVASLVLGAVLMSPTAQAQEKTLRLIPHANLTTLDPVFTTAFITRNHGYMIYDTLFGTDTKGMIKPQMVDSWKVTPNLLSWSFVLRDGLAFSDGKPVTSDDVIASLKRWSARDSLGLLLAKSVDAYVADSPKAFTIKLKQPFGVMLEALGKPSSNTPFIMPAAVAATPPNEQIKSFIGSGPYIFVAEEFKPGESATYVKNPNYKPRAEKPDGTTGGKVVKVDKVQWVFIRDPQTQFNALLAGEVDLMEMPTFEQIATLKTEKDIRLVDATPDGYQNEFRFNHLLPPFNDVRVRRAAMLALGQEAILKVQVGNPAEYKICRSMYPCGSIYSNDATGDYTGIANPKAAAALLKEAGYAGTPVVLLRPTDIALNARMPLVAKQQLQAAGFVVDVQQMDWATLLARRSKKDPAASGGWNAFMPVFGGSDVSNPLTMPMMNAAGNDGWFGWQDDPTIQDLKAKFILAGSDDERKRIAQQLQLRAFETVSHVPLGQYIIPAAVRLNVSGLLAAPANVYWNVEKK